MERRFKIAGQKMMPEDDEDCVVQESVGEYVPGALHASCFLLDGKRQRCLTYPTTDLFFLQPYDLQRFDWDDVKGFPMTSYTESLEDDRKSVENDAVHIALDYDLTSGDWDWDNPRDECVIRAAADGLYFTKKLWFVDYSLRRRARVRPTLDRHQFHGNGCRFT